MSEKQYLMVGKGVSLRLMEEEDFPLIVKWRNAEHVRNNFIYRKTFTVEGQKQWKKEYIDTGKVVQFIICENKSPDKRPVGSVYLRDIDRNEKSAEYGIFIGEMDALGKGYGSETAKMTVSYARNTMGLKKLILRVFKSNVYAIRSYEHAGFRTTEDLPGVECSDGQKGDMILMELSL